VDGEVGRVPGRLLMDFYALPDREPVQATVVHDPGCTLSPCACFGISAEIREIDDSIWQLRLLYLDEVVGTCRLVLMGGTLIVSAASSYRASTTEDWAHHHRVVAELLLRECTRFADERGWPIATSLDEPRALLAELGYARVGLLMRREPQPAADPVCREQGHDHSTSSCRGPAGA
jgi:hypothetical protein